MTIGDRCKAYEAAETERKAMRGIPLMARLDGKAFHTFTRGLERPYDERMSHCMVETTKYLVDKMHARVGYTQSDEITLMWWEEEQGPAQFPFDGKFHKLTSVLAGMASAKFTKMVQETLPNKANAVPCFDCRVWQVPTLNAAVEVFVWREDDAVKNSISAAAQSVYSHKELLGKHSGQQQEMLFQRGINWNDYPAFFKRGTYVQRKTSAKFLTEQELAKIPAKHRPAADEPVVRSSVVELGMPPIRKVLNIWEVLLHGTNPFTKLNHEVDL